MAAEFNSHLDRLLRCLEGLNDHEREIVVREAEDIASGLLRGLREYGHWDPKTDARDHEREAEEEDLDRRVYSQMKRIAADMRNDTIPAPPEG